MIRANSFSPSNSFVLLFMLAVVASASFHLSSIRNHRSCHRLAFLISVGERKRCYWPQPHFLGETSYVYDSNSRNDIWCRPKQVPSPTIQMTRSSLFSTTEEEKCKLDQDIIDQNDDEFDNDNQKMQDDDDVDDDEDGELSDSLPTTDDGDDNTSTTNLPKGIPESFCIIDHRRIPKTGFTNLQLESAFSAENIARLKLTTDDVTVPVALLLLFPEQFATYTKARKESRRNKILVARGSPSEKECEVPNFDRRNLFIGKVADRV